ncbi:MAG: methyltransferase domain-containing protein [Nitrososphaerota archaeon]|jgi:ubiquinone/menaquinone biosynthesis C-methylase UbiE|nr:methyltransferase domain-containing protein [Nitrososphaerota archaeon]
MKVKYSFNSFFYDLMGVFYFNREKYSPRAALLDFIPDSPIRVLDICAGTGTNSLVIAKSRKQVKVTALDLSGDMLKIADKKCQKAKIDNVELLAADACNICLPDNLFDVVLISLVLHEVESDVKKAILYEAKRVSKRNGCIIVVEWEQPKKFLQKIMFSTIKVMEPKGFTQFLHADLTAFFNKHCLITVKKQSCDYTQVLMLSKVEHQIVS